nr:MAG TPA: hypothetical protein [Bacteriophage sp.]
MDTTWIQNVYKFYNIKAIESIYLLLFLYTLSLCHTSAQCDAIN